MSFPFAKYWIELLMVAKYTLTKRSIHFIIKLMLHVHLVKWKPCKLAWNVRYFVFRDELMAIAKDQVGYNADFVNYVQSVSLIELFKIESLQK